MTATPLRPPLLMLQRSWQRYRQAPVLLAGWALGWMLLWQLTALLPLPLWLQFGASLLCFCLLYTSPSPRDGLLSRMPSSA